MKSLNKELTYYIISSIIFSLILIFSVILLVKNYISHNIRDTYIEKDVVIDIEPSIGYKLLKLDDYNGLKIKPNQINITNNGTLKRYQILLTPLNNNEQDIRVNINNQVITNLSQLPKKDNTYIIYEGTINNEVSIFHKISFWLKDTSSLEELPSNFKLKVKIL